MSEKVRDPFELIGTTIEGKYRVASVIGDGGFGVVYRGVHTGFGELIAIKCLKIPTNLDDKHRDELLEQLREEGRLLHKLSKATPGIVQALDVGAMTTPAGVWVPFLVLEWLDGETVAELQKRREDEGLGPMPLAEAIELLTPAARALAVAHQHKIAHRDVKPANLFVAKVGDKRTVKVLDFGIAKVLTDTTMTEALAVTKQGPSAFTPRYGAPEQFNKQRGATGPWTDVFALALIVVELATGKRALEGDDPTQLYIAAADPTLRPTLRGRGLDAPELVENVINKALHVEPKYRYAEAGEFWDALTGAAGVAPDVARSSQPSASSGREKPAGSDRKIDSDNLNTAEFAAQASIAVTSVPRHSGPPEPHAATQPFESRGLGNPPQIVVSAKGATGPAASATSASAQVAAEAKEPPAPPRGRPRADDPMAETPPLDRVPQVVAELTKPSAAPAKQAAPEKKPSVTTTTGNSPMSAPASSEGPAPSGRGIYWALLAIAATAGVTVYLYFDGFGKKGGSGASGVPSGAPSAKHLPNPKTSGSAVPSASPSASEAPDASAPLAEAGAPPAPPDDMVFIAPFSGVKLGEGATLRDVTLSKGFYIEKREAKASAYHACVTAGVCTPSAVRSKLRFENADADAGADAGPSEEALAAEDVWKRRCTEGTEPEHPINCVTYAQAEQFCRWRKRRLPTEAEWEATAQGLEGRAYPWGNSRPDCDRACIDKNQECRSGDVATCAAGSRGGDKTPNDVVDLGGNVAEWVADGFLAKPVAGTDPRASPFFRTRVVRGGSFFDGLDLLRSATRREMPAGAAEAWLGVRCAMDVPTQ